ncbi:MAG TPA: SDR family NAD(P)-dependent oxidoreductase [Candidatus Didemnitutus sp.]|nr:SDR family NAD(P)-dependent oxidoreductase [Candidatus Didemnitutus sp.]
MPIPLSARYPTAFVTGASSGLGQAFADMLLAEGVEVWGTSRDAARLTARPRFHPVALELSDGPAAERIFRTCDEAAGGFAVVVNNAGCGVFGGFAETEFSHWQNQLEVMLVNTARLSHAALQSMRARGRGALVNISSLAAEFSLPYQSAYNMVKSGLSALNESLMYEVAGTGVIVIDFRPGDYCTNSENAVVHPNQKSTDPRAARVWEVFARTMQAAPPPVHAAASLRRALARGRSGTVRTGSFFQARVAPFLARFGSLSLKRRVQSGYFGL